LEIFLFSLPDPFFIGQLYSAKPKLIFARTSTTARDALALLAKNRIVSIPVWDDATKQFVAFLSVVDIFPYSLGPGRTLCLRSGNVFTLSDVLKELGDDEGIQVDVFIRSTPVSAVCSYLTEVQICDLRICSFFSKKKKISFSPSHPLI
jgi:CBS domain-containing protein